MTGTGEGMSSGGIIELLVLKNSELEQQKTKLIELLKKEHTCCDNAVAIKNAIENGCLSGCKVCQYIGELGV